MDLAAGASPSWRSARANREGQALAAYLDEEDEAEIHDEHVERLNLEDAPDLVVIQVYITSAYRSYSIADHYRRRGAYVVMGGLHVTSLPEEAAAHADTTFLGPGEDTWPRFLVDFRRGCPDRIYRSQTRTLAAVPPIRRDLIKRRLYLVPNSVVVSRGCPHVCDFCHLYFLDDHLFGDRRFATALFEGMRGMGRLWQAVLFVGFESLSSENLLEQRKFQNLRRDYNAAIRRLHDLGVMVNGSFVFGMDGDDRSVFGRTVEWAIEQGIETATFHILTPYPGTGLHQRLDAQRRITTQNWDVYDTSNRCGTW